MFLRVKRIDSAAIERILRAPMRYQNQILAAKAAHLILMTEPSLRREDNAFARLDRVTG